MLDEGGALARASNRFMGSAMIAYVVVRKHGLNAPLRFGWNPA